MSTEKEEHRDESGHYERPAYILGACASRDAEKQRLVQERSNWRKLRSDPMTFFTFVIAFSACLQCLSSVVQPYIMSRQLSEMQSGSGDTHQSALAASKQADAARSQSANTAMLAEATKAQSENTALLARSSREQVAKLEGEIMAIRQQTEAYARPWLKVAVSAQGYSADQDSFHFEAVMTNVGHSVANNISLRSRVIAPSYISPGAAFIPFWSQQELCGASLRSNMKDDPSQPQKVSIFPDEKATITFDNSLREKGVIVQLLPSPNMAKVRIVKPILIGCVDYLFPNATEYHQTGFVYTIEGLDKATQRTFLYELDRGFMGGEFHVTKYIPSAEYAY